MRRRRLLALLCLLCSCAPACALNTTDAYRIDPDASQAMFRVRLFWLGSVSGHFTHVEGQVISGPRPDSWLVNATIDVNSVAMSSARLRRWILAPPFFDAEHHPIIRFESDAVAREALEHGGDLSGSLTMRGVTEPIHFALDPVHCEQLASASCHILLRGNLQRSAFGMTTDRVALSDTVDLNLNITLQRETL